jgi:hypothetical protein
MHMNYLLLSLYIHTLCGIFCNVFAEAIPSAQLLPDGFSAFGNYEVLSVHDEGDEDIVRIRKRAEQEDCLSDCIDYSGWTENGLMQCGAGDVDGEAVPVKRSLLGRGRKPSNVCVAFRGIILHVKPRLTVSGLCAPK